MGFYVTLPSDASMDIFANNTQSTYTTVLKNTIVVDSSYAVALVEISYSQSITVNMGSMIMKIGDDIEINIPITAKEYQDIPSFLEYLNSMLVKKYFEKVNQREISLEMIGYEMNNKSQSRMKRIADDDDDCSRPNLSPMQKLACSMLGKTQFVEINAQDEILEIKIPKLKSKTETPIVPVTKSPEKPKVQATSRMFLPENSEQFKNDLETIKNYRSILPSFSVFSGKSKADNFIKLKIPENHSIELQGKLLHLFNVEREEYKATQIFRVDFDNVRVMDTIYIYSDILQEQYVGDTLAPLLRTVTTHSNNSHYVSSIYDNPHYIPLKNTRISSINIELKDDLGRPIQFTNLLSKVLIKLHFKKLNEL